MKTSRVRPINSVLVDIASGTSAAALVEREAIHPNVLYLNRYQDDTLHTIGGEALVQAKHEGIQWAIYQFVNQSELEIHPPNESEMLFSAVTHERLLEFVAHFDVIGRPSTGENSFGEWMFVVIRMPDKDYVFYGLGARRDGKIVRNDWRFYIDHNDYYKNRSVFPHANAMQLIIERRREVDLWDDPPREQTEWLTNRLNADGDIDAAIIDWEDE